MWMMQIHVPCAWKHLQVTPRHEVHIGFYQLSCGQVAEGFR